MSFVPPVAAFVAAGFEHSIANMYFIPLGLFVVLAVLLLFMAFMQTDGLSFIGIRQLFEKESAGALVTRGLYRVVRHPLYTFSLLYIWLSPSVSQNSLVFYIGVTLYVLIGAYFEERKLLRDFGEAYAEYRSKTPMLIPGLVFGKR